MKNYSRLAFSGALVCGIVLGIDALYISSVNIYFADALVLLALVICSSYLLKQAQNRDKTAHSSLQESSAFHLQLGNEMVEQLSSAHTELGNTQAIVGDAINKLVGNFILISDGVRDLSEQSNVFSKQTSELLAKIYTPLADAGSTDGSHSDAGKAAITGIDQHLRTIMEELASFNNAVAHNAIKLNTISANVEQNVLMVISTLQFQDMSFQLIEHAKSRMSALKQVANEMGKELGTPNQSEYLERIEAYNRLLDQHVASLNKQKANPVAQKDFGAGSIELF